VRLLADLAQAASLLARELGVVFVAGSEGRFQMRREGLVLAVVVPASAGGALDWARFEAEALGFRSIRTHSSGDPVVVLAAGVTGDRAAIVPPENLIDDEDPEDAAGGFMRPIFIDVSRLREEPTAPRGADGCTERPSMTDDSGIALTAARTVEILSSRFTRLDRKAWDGYLVLLTSALAVEADATVHEIRYDTSRIRKIVATGEGISSLNDVERTLLPLLPLTQDAVELEDEQSPLDELPERLERTGIARELVETAIAAFKDHRPIVQELHRQLTN